MARYRTCSIAFKREVVREYLGGEVSLHGLAKRHRICRNLIRLWLAKYEAGEFNEEAAMAASVVRIAQTYLASGQRRRKNRSPLYERIISPRFRVRESSEFAPTKKA